MKIYPFDSILKTEFVNYMDLRAAQGHSAKENAILHSLDVYLQKENHSIKTLTSSIVDGWVLNLPKNMHANTKIVYVSHYSGFAKYLNLLGMPAFIPERPSGESTYTPYIFTQDEINRLFAAADSMKFTKKFVMQFPVIIRLLYSCGMRVDEVLSLKMVDVDLNDGILIVKNGKGKKDRYVPLKEDLTDILKRYCSFRQKEPYSDDWLFENTNNEKHSTTWVRETFNKCLDSAKIIKPDLQRNARNICPHCLRHTFAVHSFQKQEQLGVDVYAAAPLLAAFMGHANFRDTEYYLRLTDEIGQEIISKTSDYANVFPEVPR